jgi:hypothetical protein
MRLCLAASMIDQYKGTIPKRVKICTENINIYVIINVRRKLPLPHEPAGVIPKEGTNLYWVAKLQGAVERQYSFYTDSCLVKIHVLL